MEKLKKELDQKLKALVPGSHLCLIYKTAEEHRQVATSFIRQGLEQGQKVVYIADATAAEDILNYLYGNGLNVESYLKSGRLGLFNSDKAFMRTGIFDPDEMITFLKEEAERALGEGYAALRATGEMTWVLKGLAGSERLIEYESKLNDFFPQSKCLAMCQYDKRKFEPGVLLDILATHPLAVIGTEVFENLYYIPPEDFLGPHPEEAKLNKWLCRLSERSRSEKTLRASEEKYRLLVNNLPGIVYKGFKDFSVEFFDNKIEALTGYPLDEFNSGRLKWSDLIVQADLKASRECFIRALKTDKSYAREYRIKSRGGDIRWIGERGQIVISRPRKRAWEPDWDWP